jgi:hypothetical protein
VVSGTATYGTGKISNGLNLDGTDDYVSMNYATDPTAYTISMRVKPTTIAAKPLIVRTNASGPASNFYYMLRMNSTGKFEHYVNDGSAKTVTGTTTAVANNWYHVAAVASNGGQMLLYVNGVLEGSAVNIGTLSTSGDRFHVGNSANGGAFGYFAGMVDDLRIYHSALNATQVGNLAQLWAGDGFESNSVSGGNGWGGNWSFIGTAGIVSTGTPKDGTYHLRLTGNTGVATRAANLSGLTSARLIFDWKADQFEAGEYATVDIFNGTNWIEVLRVNDEQDNNTYQNANIDLSLYTLTSSFQVRIRSLMNDANDFFYVDNLRIIR